MQKYKLIILSLLLSACSSQITTTAERDYIKAENGPKLKVPTPLSQKDISHYYDLPNPTAPYKKINLTPPVL